MLRLDETAAMIFLIVLAVVMWAPLVVMHFANRYYTRKMRALHAELEASNARHGAIVTAMRAEMDRSERSRQQLADLDAKLGDKERARITDIARWN